MNKIIKKYDANRASAIKWTAYQFGVTEQYVRNIDNNQNLNGGQCNEIRKAFRTKYSELQKILSKSKSHQ